MARVTSLDNGAMVSVHSTDLASFLGSVQKYYYYVQKYCLFWAFCRNITGQRAPGIPCRAIFGACEEILVSWRNIHLCLTLLIKKGTHSHKKVWIHLLPRRYEVVMKGYYRECIFLINLRHQLQERESQHLDDAWRLESIVALARIKARDNPPKSWPVTSPSSDPLHLVRAASPAQMPQSEICPMSPFQMERRQYPQATWRRASAVFLIFFGQTRACLGCRARHIFPI